MDKASTKQRGKIYNEKAIILTKKNIKMVTIHRAFTRLKDPLDQCRVLDNLIGWALVEKQYLNKFL